MDLSNLETLKSLCQQYGIRPDPDSGQHFLINPQVLEKIVAAANLSRQDTVLEIGPGLGTLTQALAQRAGRIVAIELDPKLSAAAREILSPYKNVEIITGNFLTLPIVPFQLTTGNYKLIANLPYHITGRALRKILTHEPKPTMAVLMVQKEVAERITARPGNMSVLSVMCQLYAAPTIVATVPRENFWPQPEVDSAVVTLRVCSSEELAKMLKIEISAEDVMRVVKIGFAARRKTLANNLRAVFTSPSSVLRFLRLLEKCRAQELSIEQWISLAKKLKK